MPQPATIRKAIEAGAGVIVIGLLEYITASTDAAEWLEQLVPAPLVPLVPVLLGGLTLTYRVWRYGNTVTEAPSGAAPSLEVPASTGNQLAIPSGPDPVPAAEAATPPVAYSAAAEAAGTPDAPVLPELRDPAAAEAVAASLAPLEPPANPPTSFIPLPTR